VIGGGGGAGDSVGANFGATGLARPDWRDRTGVNRLPYRGSGWATDLH
jgi:hypothetical protein